MYLYMSKEDTIFSRYLGHLETVLKSNNDGQDFFFGGKVPPFPVFFHVLPLFASWRKKAGKPGDEARRKLHYCTLSSNTAAFFIVHVVIVVLVNESYYRFVHPGKCINKIKKARQINSRGTQEYWKVELVCQHWWVNDLWWLINTPHSSCRSRMWTSLCTKC